MSKRQLIEEIQQINTTVTVEFLNQFDEPALQQYLERLVDAQKHTLQIASWARKRQRVRMAS